LCSPDTNFALNMKHGAGTGGTGVRIGRSITINPPKSQTSNHADTKISVDIGMTGVKSPQHRTPNSVHNRKFGGSPQTLPKTPPTNTKQTRFPVNVLLPTKAPEFDDNRRSKNDAPSDCPNSNSEATPQPNYSPRSPKNQTCNS
jgi:hypothetical protein